MAGPGNRSIKADRHCMHGTSPSRCCPHSLSSSGVARRWIRATNKRGQLMSLPDSQLSEKGIYGGSIYYFRRASRNCENDSSVTAITILDALYKDRTSIIGKLFLLYSANLS